MKFGNWARSAMLGLALTGLATAAEATVFTISDIELTSNTEDYIFDFRVFTDSLAPTSFDLEEGQTKSVALFDIWTPDNAGLDGSEPFSMTLNFSEPLPPFSGSAGGETAAIIVGWIFFPLVPLVGPELGWDDHVITFNFGSQGDGVLELRLEDTVFKDNCHTGGFTVFTGGHHQKKCRTTVYGEFTLVKDATEVPEPATIAVLGLGLGALGVFGMRRRHAA